MIVQDALLGAPGGLVLIGREPAQTGLDAFGVVPGVDVGEQRVLGLLTAAP